MMAAMTSSTFSAVPSAQLSPVRKSGAVILESRLCCGYALALMALSVWRCRRLPKCSALVRAAVGATESISNIVAHAVDHLAGSSCLNRCGGACGIGVLADEDAALAHESVCGFTLGCYVCPAVCEGDIHVRFGDYASDSEQEGCARNDLGIGIGSDIADMGSSILPASKSSLSFMPATTPET